MQACRFTKGQTVYFLNPVVGEVCEGTIERVCYDAFSHETFCEITSRWHEPYKWLLKGADLYDYPEDARKAKRSDEEKACASYKASIRTVEDLFTFPLDHVLCGEHKNGPAYRAYIKRAEELGIIPQKKEGRTVENIKYDAKYFAELLNEREMGEEISRGECALAKENGIVVVFGYSDDCMEMRGAVYEEMDCFDGGRFWIDREGNISEEELPNASIIDAIWCGPSGASWAYETEIPHETFEIFEDEELYCRGIVFALSDVGAT